MKSYEQIAKSMYEAYLSTLENGDHEPFWGDLSDNQRDAWVAAAQAGFDEYKAVH